MGCRQCLPLSVVQLKGKHCRKLHCHNGVVDTFGPSLLIFEYEARQPSYFSFLFNCFDCAISRKFWGIWWFEKICMYILSDDFLLWTMFILWEVKIMIVKEVVAVMESTLLCGTNAVGSRTVNCRAVGRSENRKGQVNTNTMVSVCTWYP